MFKKKFPAPQEFKMYQSQKWAFDQKMAKKELENTLDYIANKLRQGENTIGFDCINNCLFSRDAMIAALAVRGWKLRSSGYYYELIPLDS